MQMESSRGDYSIDYLITPEKSLYYNARTGEITDGIGVYTFSNIWFSLPLLDKNILKSWGEVTVEKESIENKDYIVLEISFKTPPQILSSSNQKYRFYFDSEALKLEKVEHKYGHGATQILEVKEYKKIGEYYFPVKIEGDYTDLSITKIQINPGLSEDLFELKDETALTYFSNYNEEKIKIELSNDPANADLYYTSAKFLYNQKREFSAAIQEYKKAILLKPNARAAYFGLANAYSQGNEREKAIKVYRESINKFPESANHIYQMLLSLYQRELYSDLDKALELSQQWVKEKPNSYSAYAALADLLQKKNKINEAIQAYEKLLENPKIPEHPKIYSQFQLAKLYLKQERGGEAEKLLKNILEQEDIASNHYQITQAQKELFNYYQTEGKLDEFKEEILTKIKENPNNTKLLKQLAEIYKAGSEYKKSIEIYEKIISLNPDDKPLYQELANLYKQTGKKEKQIELYENLIKKFPELKAQYLQQLMYAYQQAGRNEKAIEIIEEYLKENPEYVYAYSMAANLYRKLKNYDKVIQMYRKAIELEQFTDNQANYLIQIGSIYAQQKKYEEAEKAYEEAKTKSKQEWIQQSANNQITEIYRQMGKMQELIKKYEVQLKTEPKNSNLLGELASAYHNVKNYEKAIELYEDLIANFPENKQRYLSSLMHAYQQIGRNEDALKTAEKLIKERPDYAHTYATAANLYNNLKDYDKAIEMYRKAIALEEHADNQVNYLLEIGRIYAQQKKYEEAEKAYEEAKTKSKQEWTQREVNRRISQISNKKEITPSIIKKELNNLIPENNNIRDEMNTRIDKAINYRNDNSDESCYIVIGQLVLNSYGNVQNDVKTQMDILPGGYFVALVKDTSRPLSFRMHGYKPLDVDLNAIIKQPFANVGTLHLSPLSSEEEASLIGKVILEGKRNVSKTNIEADIRQLYNTPHNCTADSYGRYANLNYNQAPISISVDMSGVFQKQGFSPTDYTIMISAHGYVPQRKLIKFQSGETFNMGTIFLELPKKIILTYTGSGLNGDKLNTTISSDSNKRWKPQLSGYWSLSFLQNEGKLKLESHYGPWYATDLGYGTLDSFKGAENTKKEQLLNQPHDLEIKDGHIYLVKSNDGKWLLFEAKIE